MPPPEGSVSKRREIAQARPTVLAVPPGKRNGREHQDSGRRHLLVKEIVNDPRPSNIAALRPLEELSAKDGRFHQSIPQAFSTAIPCGEAGAILGGEARPGVWRQQSVARSSPTIRVTAVLIDAACVKSWL